MATPARTTALTLTALAATVLVAGASAFGGGAFLATVTTGAPAPSGTGTPVEPTPPASPPAVSAPAPPPEETVPHPEAVTGSAARPGGVPRRESLTPDRTGPYGSRLTSGSAAVALTFDDGPHPVHTQQTLDVLREYRVHATFCLVGRNVVAYPHLVRAIAADGHTLCNHSWNHDFDLGSYPAGTIRADLMRTTAAIREAAPGHPVSYYRQPGGFWTPTVVRSAEELGMTSIHWTVDPADYFQPGAGSIAATVTAQAVQGSVVLLHDAGGNRIGTVQALRTILPNLLRRFVVDALPPGAEPMDQRSRQLHLKLGQI